MKLKILEGMDLDHTYQAVMDALYNSDNVSKQEVLLVSSILNELAQNKVLKASFREWAETHHEIVCTIHAMIDNETMPPRLERILGREGFGGLYDLGIELTNEFCNTYENEDWGGGDWLDTIIYFTKLKLK